MGENRELLVAIDDGYAQTKLYGEGLDASGAPVSFMMRSSARPGRYGIVSLTGQGGIGAYETEEGEDFTVSDEVEAENTQFDGFHTSTMNRALVHHALAAAGYGGQSVRLITGLPVGDYFFDGEKDEEKIAAKRANLLKGITSVTKAPLAQLADVRVGCQAIAAFVDYLLADDLAERDVPSGRVAVVDIGGRTTDIAVVIDGARFDEARSGTENVGALDVYNTLAKGIRARFKTRDKYPLALMDRAVRSGRIALWGEDQDVSDIVRDTVREQEVKIAREVERRLGAASNVDVVLFVGGGAALFSDIAGHFRNGRVAEDPEFANARGLFKYARRFPD